MTIKKGNFILFQVRNGWIVYNTCKKFEEGHTHIRNKTSALAAVDFVSKEKIPRKYSNYYLISLKRLSNNPKYIAKVDSLLNIRQIKGKKERYYNR